MVTIDLFVFLLTSNSKHVLTEDLISRTVAGKKLFSTRLLTKTNRMPKWGYAIFGNNQQHVCIVEESILDPEKKSMTTYTRNIGYQKFMVRIPPHTIIIRLNKKCCMSQSLWEIGRPDSKDIFFFFFMPNQIIDHTATMSTFSPGELRSDWWTVVMFVGGFQED